MFMPKFIADWSISADDKSVNEVKYNSIFIQRADNSDYSLPIRFIIELLQDLTATYIFDQVWCRLIIICRC